MATHYHLGVTLYKTRKGRMATRHFETVIQLAEDSRYAELAREYIRAIAEQRSNSQRQGAINRFWLIWPNWHLKRMITSVWILIRRYSLSQTIMRQRARELHCSGLPFSR